METTKASPICRTTSVYRDSIHETCSGFSACLVKWHLVIHEALEVLNEFWNITTAGVKDEKELRHYPLLNSSELLDLSVQSQIVQLRFVQAGTKVARHLASLIDEPYVIVNQDLLSTLQQLLLEISSLQRLLRHSLHNKLIRLNHKQVADSHLALIRILHCYVCTLQRCILYNTNTCPRGIVTRISKQQLPRIELSGQLLSLVRSSIPVSQSKCFYESKLPVKKYPSSDGLQKPRQRDQLDDTPQSKNVESGHTSSKRSKIDFDVSPPNMKNDNTCTQDDQLQCLKHVCFVLKDVKTAAIKLHSKWASWSDFINAKSQETPLDASISCIDKPNINHKQATPTYSKSKRVNDYNQKYPFTVTVPCPSPPGFKGEECRQNLVFAVPSEEEGVSLAHEVITNNCYLKNGIQLKPSATVVDVGAFTGMFSTLCLTQQHNIHVIAVEALPEHAKMLRHNLSANQTCFRPGSSFSVECLALGKTSGQCTLHSWEATPAEATLFPEEREHRRLRLQQAAIRLLLLATDNQYETPPTLCERDSEIDEVFTSILKRGCSAQAAARMALEALQLVQSPKFTQEIKISTMQDTLSAVIKKHNIKTIDLLKLDCEGSELDILECLEEYHWDKIQQVVAEIHSSERLKRVEAILKSHGFGGIVIDQQSIKIDEDCSVDFSPKSLDLYFLYACRSEKT